MKFLVLSFKPIKVIAILILAGVLAGMAVYSTSAQSVFFGYAERRVPIYSVQTDSKKIAITFDAAYGSEETTQIINILKEKNAKATFFLVGFWVEKYPELVKLLDESGIEIGTHSNTHPYMSKLTADQIRVELETSKNLITNITGKQVKIFRPPYGDYNDTLINVCDEIGLKTIQWSVDSLDWKGLNTSQMLARITPDIDNGGIILFHNNSDHIVEALPIIIDTLLEQGYELVCISDLIYEDNYTINNNGIQIKNN